MPKLPKTGQVAVLTTLILLLAAGCSSTPGPSEGAIAAEVASTPYSSDVRERLHEQFLAWVGVPYREGGGDRRGIDCSAFVQIAYKNAFGIRLPRSTDQLSQTGTHIPRKQLTAGDLVFFKTGFAKQHVGIYMGEGRFIHASTSRGVMMSELHSPYWSKHFWKSTRVLGA